MLNIFTPLFRINNLAKVSESIPKHEDVNWVIVTCESNNFNLDKYEDKATIILLKTKEGAENLHLKFKAASNVFKKGFFYGLDDDTTLNENVYKIYTKYKNTHKMIIGKQLHIHKGKVETRLNEAIPECCKIDGAQALIHTDILKQFQIKPFNQSICADALLLLDCWNAIEPKEKILIPEVISNYNFLR